MSEDGLHSVSPDATAGKPKCPNCGDARSGRFCAACGQNDRSYTRGLASVTWDLCRESLEVDGRLIQTLKLLLFKPGRLTSEFSDDRRARYMSPVRLYLFASFLFVLVLSLAMPDSFSDSELVMGGDDGGKVEVEASSRRSPTVTEIAALKASLGPGRARKADDILGRPDGNMGRAVLIALADGASPERPNVLMRMFRASMVDLLHDPEVFVQRVIGNLPIAMFFLLPFLALALALCYFRKKRFFVEHLVFGMHNQTFTFLCLAAALLTPEGSVGRWFRLFLIAIPQVYYLFALRRYYGDGWMRTLVKGFAVWWLYMVFLLPGFFLVLFLTA